MTSGSSPWDTNDGPDPRKVQLIMALRRSGITDARVLSAIETTPREHFMPQGLAHLAYADKALPIDCGQTISQPYIVALMSQALDVKPEHTVLEVGTGSGYQTAILAKLAGKVFTIERWPELMAQAQDKLATLRVDNVEFRHGDGGLGWPEAAPFDRIIVTAAAPERPDALLGELKDGGVLVAPVGGPVDDDNGQKLMRYMKTNVGVTGTAIADVRFVPLLPGVGRES